MDNTNPSSCIVVFSIPPGVWARLYLPLWVTWLWNINLQGNPYVYAGLPALFTLTLFDPLKKAGVSG